MTRRRGNELDGKTWTRYSISVWSDIRKTPEEIQTMRQSGLGWGEIAHRLHQSLGHIKHLGRTVSANKP